MLPSVIGPLGRDSRGINPLARTPPPYPLQQIVLADATKPPVTWTRQRRRYVRLLAQLRRLGRSTGYFRGSPVQKRESNQRRLLANGL
jgi:hypothetical protein